MIERSDAFTEAEREEARREAADDDSSTHAVVKRLVEEAVKHYEEELLPDQEAATDRYFGRPYGDEEEGRSKVVSTEVRDAVEAVMPSLLRIFLGGESTVEFRPRGLEDAELAKQQTDVINYIVREQNNAFVTFMGTFDDALLRRLGAVKAFWEETVRVEGETYHGLTEDQLALLGEEEDVTIDEVEQSGTHVVEGQGPNGEPIVNEVPLYDARITRRITDGRVCIEAIPNEEFAYSPGARVLDDARCVVHRREMHAGDLVAMGIPKELVEDAIGRAAQLEGNELNEARAHTATDQREHAEGDWSTRPVLYTEAYVKVDIDGDGIGERRMFQCLGPDYKPVDDEGEIVEDLPFAVFTGRPLAHRLDGMSFYDFLKDIERIVTQLERGVLDSMSLALEPQTFVNDQRVNIGDLASPEISGIVRVKGDPNVSVREVKHQFIGPEALQVLEYYQHKKEERTGITKASQGLDADSLQSSTKAAVAGTLAAAQQRIEMIARAFAETGMRPLFKLLLKLVIRHQNRPFVVKLRGKYVEVDPRTWDATMDVVVNVGLGTGSFEERVQALSAIAEDQITLLQLGSPLVTWQEVRATRAKLIELIGFRAADEFYRPWGPTEEEQYQQALAQQPQSDPNAALVEIERAKAQAKAQHDELKLQIDAQNDQRKLQMEERKLALDELRARLEDDRERDRIAREIELKRYEIELKHKAEIDRARLNAAVAADRAAMDADVRREVARSTAKQGDE